MLQTTFIPLTFASSVFSYSCQSLLKKHSEAVITGNVEQASISSLKQLTTGGKNLQQYFVRESIFPQALYPYVAFYTYSYPEVWRWGGGGGLEVM